MTDDDNVFGELCHIEAASEGGPRYNANQSPDERISFENLIVMCTYHHKLVDKNKESFTVERLKKMKSDHEKNRKPIDVSDNLLEKAIKSVEQQYEQLDAGVKSVKEETKEIVKITRENNAILKDLQNAMSSSSSEQNSLTNSDEYQIYKGNGFTISWPNSWTIFDSNISQEELEETYFHGKMKLETSNPKPIIQIRSKKNYFGIYPAASVGVTSVPQMSLKDIVDYVTDDYRKAGFIVHDSHVDNLLDEASIISSMEHGTAISYSMQKLFVKNGHLFGLQISKIMDEQIKEYPQLVKELKHIAQSFRFIS